MPDRPPSPGCDICGKPPHSSAQDIKETSRTRGVDGDMVIVYGSHGAVRYGCDEHPVKSVCYRLDGSVE